MSESLQRESIFSLNVFLTVAIFLLFVGSVQARVGVVMMESIPGTAAMVAKGGHSAILLSETCTDDFLTLRKCTQQDPVWGVIAERTASFSSKAEYDWLALPAALSLNSVERNDHAPLIVNDHIRKRLIQRHYFTNAGFRRLVVGNDPSFEQGMETSEDYGIPDGRWQNFFGSQLRRSIWIVWIEDDGGEFESNLVETINGLSNRPKYGTLLFLFLGNCSKWVKGAMSGIEGFDKAGFGNNWAGDGIFTSPKGITEEAFKAARKLMEKHADVMVTVDLIPQTPGLYPRSELPLYTIESGFKNKLVWPAIAFFHPIVYLAGRFYFRFIKRFSVQEKYLSYFDRPAALISVRKEAGDAGSAARNDLRRMRNDFFGNRHWWDRKRTEFESVLRAAREAGLIDSERKVKKGGLLRHLLDERAELGFDETGAPLLVRRGKDGREVRAGLSFQNVRRHDTKLGFLIMLSRINWTLSEKSPARRGAKDAFQKEWDVLLSLLESNLDPASVQNGIVAEPGH